MNKFQRMIVDNIYKQRILKEEQIKSMSKEQIVDELNEITKLTPEENKFMQDMRILLKGTLIVEPPDVPTKNWLLSLGIDFARNLVVCTRECISNIINPQLGLAGAHYGSTSDATTTETDPLVPALKQAGVAVVPVRVIQDGDTLKLCLWWFENRPAKSPSIHTSVESLPESIAANCEIELDDHQATANFPGLIKKWGDTIPDDLKIGLNWNAEANELTVDFSQ